MFVLFIVIPAKAGIQIENFCFSSLPNSCRADARRWIPAFAGMTMFFEI
jgi:hypothetical protein